MPIITVRLGCGDPRYAQFRVSPPAPVEFDVVLVSGDVVEFSPEAVFTAANRICDVDDDCRALNHEWQRTMRRRLDSLSAPSMSVGDSFVLYSGFGGPIGTWTCMPSGWRFDAPHTVSV